MVRVLDNYQTQNKQITLITNQIPFYGESGGQMGDARFITSGYCKIKALDTLNYRGKLYGLVCELEEGLITEMME